MNLTKAKEKYKMDSIVIVFTILLIPALKKSNGSFLSRENCLAIRGAMSFIIIFGHLAQRTGGGG